jgi:hypothetical protein
MFTIGVSAGVEVYEFRGLLEISEFKGRVGTFPFGLEGRLMGVMGSCIDSGGTRTDDSPVKMPLGELPHPFEVLSTVAASGCLALRLV